MRMAILGGGGCFGLACARHALAQGHEVLSIGRSPMKPACFSMEFSHDVRGFQYVQLHLVDDLDTLIDVLHSWAPELIVNFAAQGEGQASFDPVTYSMFYETNTQGVVRLVGRLRAKPLPSLERFIHIGTSELYGPVTSPSKETDTLRPSSPYAASKAGADLHLMAEGKRFPWNVIRPSNCYTPGQQLYRVVPRAMLQALTSGMMELHGGGRAEKSYLDARDLCSAIMTVAEKAPTQEIYNCGPEQPISIRMLVELCAKMCGVPLAKFVTMAGEREGQDSRYWLDSSKLRALGWEPRVSFESGLFEMYRWVHAYRDDLLREPVQRPDQYRLAA
jgi:dTDP-glucose 4,6-dehydratase